MRAEPSTLQSELVHVQLGGLVKFCPVPENDDTYQPIDLDSPDTSCLARSVEGTQDLAGDAIAADLLKSFRPDFGIEDIEVYKVALTIEQVREFDLAPSMEAKANSPTYRAFVGKYGITDAYELEALAPSDLVAILKDAIEQVIDLDLFNEEPAAEQADSAKIIAIRQRSDEFFGSLRLN
jgi:hypothetical protein